jgi:microsomal dipeptidase-like Zn-dependent dipeptidase
MVADLHCHYPTHVTMHDPRHRIEHVLRSRARLRRDQLDAATLRAVAALINNPHIWSTERVSVEHLQRGNARLIFSVLHLPFNEWDISVHYAAPPEEGYFAKLRAQIEEVESDLDQWPDSEVALVRDVDGLDRALASGAIAMVHCVEGGVDLGSSRDAIQRNIAELKRHGVAYITLAHLVYRQVATNAPAIPWLSDRVYHRLLPQPKGEGLSERGRVAVEAMVQNRILVDLAHMSRDSVRTTFELLDALAPGMPVINSHAGYRFGTQEYMLDATTIERIAERRGVVGLIMAQHQLNDGIRKRERKFEDSFEVICKHIDKFFEITGSHEYVAIGSDFDGFVKPTMGGLETPADFRHLELRLAERYGDDAQLITSGNAVRVLRDLWRD